MGQRCGKRRDAWQLLKAECEHCVHRPRQLTCSYLGKGQQLAYIQHSRQSVERVEMHKVDVLLPAVFDETERTIWCPVPNGDLSDALPTRRSSEPCLAQEASGNL